MLPDDELAELAADIKANGLVHPIVLDAEGVLIDGRNRLAACRMAGIEPTYTSLNGHDPVAYIVSSNVARRNLSKGQRAMAAAVLKKLRNNFPVADDDISEAYVNKASVVLKHAPGLRDAVLSGAVSLNDAYDDAKRIKDRKMSDEYRFAQLQAQDPDLATLVVEGRMTTAEAWAVVQQRIERERDNAIRHTKTLWRNLTGIWSSLIVGPEVALDGWLPAERGIDAEEFNALLTADGLRELAELVLEFADAVEERGGLDGAT